MGLHLEGSWTRWYDWLGSCGWQHFTWNVMSCGVSGVGHSCWTPFFFAFLVVSNIFLYCLCFASNTWYDNIIFAGYPPSNYHGSCKTEGGVEDYFPLVVGGLRGLCLSGIRKVITFSWQKSIFAGKILVSAGQIPISVGFPGRTDAAEGRASTDRGGGFMVIS